MAYPTTAALVAASTQADLLALNAAQQDSLRSAAITAVESFVGQAFTEFVGVLQVEAHHPYEVYLPRRMQTLTSITPYNGTAVDLGPVVVSDNGDKILFRKEAVGVGYYEQALYEISGGDYSTGFPAGVLDVDATWGWDVAPDPVALALRYDMEEQAAADANALSGTTLAFRKLGLDQISQGGLRASLASAPTLSPRVQRLLEPYIWLGRGGQLV